MNRCRLLITAFALGAIAVSCGLPLPSPDEFERASGENVVLYYPPNVADGQVKAFLETADDMWLAVLHTTGIPVIREPVILVDQTGPDALRPTWSDFYQYGPSVHLNVMVFDMSRNEVESMLLHELTHLAVGDEYGSSESFVLTEGTAMYVEAIGSRTRPGYSVDRSAIEEALGLTYAEVAAEWMEDLMTDDEVSALYDLSGMFASYWVERFGLENWYKLYTAIDCDQAGASVESVCGIAFEEICGDFRTYYP